MENDQIRRLDERAVAIAEAMHAAGVDAAEATLLQLGRVIEARGDDLVDARWLLEVPVDVVLRALTTGLDWDLLAGHGPAPEIPGDAEVLATLGTLHVAGGECPARWVARLLSTDVRLAEVQQRMFDAGWIRIRRGTDPRCGVTTRWVLPLRHAPLAARAVEALDAGRAPSAGRLAAGAVGPMGFRDQLLALGAGTPGRRLAEMLVRAREFGDAAALRTALERLHRRVTPEHPEGRGIAAAVVLLGWWLGDLRQTALPTGREGLSDDPSFVELAAAAARSEDPRRWEPLARDLIARAASDGERELGAGVALDLAAQAQLDGDAPLVDALLDLARTVGFVAEGSMLEARCELVAARAAASGGAHPAAEEHLAHATALLTAFGARARASALLSVLTTPRSTSPDERERWAARVAGAIARQDRLGDWEWATLPHPLRMSGPDQAGLRATAGGLRDVVLAGHPDAARATTQRLTPREREVSRLVADGLTNEQIARRLGLSRWTVVNHLRRVMRKLDCATRVQVATWVKTKALIHP